MPLFIVKTVMTKSDYRRFLYISAFLKKPWRILLLFGYSILCSALITYSSEWNTIKAVIIAIVIFLLMLVLQVVSIERRYSMRVATDKTGVFDSITEIEFFEDKLTTKNAEMNSISTIEYEKFYCLYESRNFLLFYYNNGQASMLRKQDIAEPEKLIEFLKTKFSGRYKKIAFNV